MTVKKTVEWQTKQAQKRARRARRKKKQGQTRQMSDAARLYRAVLSNLVQFVPTMKEENCLSLAMMITGILRSKSGQLSKIARAVQYAHKKESLVTRLQRFVRNPKLEVELAYAPFGSMVLAALSSEQIVLMVDSTKLGGQCLCLMVSVYYKSRALPLAWVVYKGRKGHSSQATQLALFKAVKALLPETSQVILLGDGEFDGSQLLAWFETETTWQFVCRTDRTNLIWYENQWLALEHWPLAAGQETFLTNVRLTQAHQVGPVNILVVWHEAKNCHWFFVTNLETAKAAKKWYTKRFTTETLFSDFKDRRFHLDDTRLWQPDRVSRLLLAGSIAYVFSVVLGVEAITSGVFRQLVRTDAFFHSLFQLGLIYLDHILNECLSFPALTSLPPPSDFEHVVISWLVFLTFVNLKGCTLLNPKFKSSQT